MNVDEIKKLRAQSPFAPFQIVLVDGRVFNVPHPEFCWVAPGVRSWVWVADPDGLPEMINTAVISSVRPQGKAPEAGPNGRRKKRPR
jgi:hypothetical protein